MYMSSVLWSSNGTAAASSAHLVHRFVFLRWELQISETPLAVHYHEGVVLCLYNIFLTAFF